MSSATDPEAIQPVLLLWVAHVSVCGHDIMELLLRGASLHLRSLLQKRPEAVAKVLHTVVHRRLPNRVRQQPSASEDRLASWRARFYPAAPHIGPPWKPHSRSCTPQR